MVGIEFVVLFVRDQTIVIVFADKVILGALVVQLIGAETVSILAHIGSKLKSQIIKTFFYVPNSSTVRDVVVEMQHVVIAAEEVVPFQVKNSQLWYGKRRIVELFAVDKPARTGFIKRYSLVCGGIEHVEFHPLACTEFVFRITRCSKGMLDGITRYACISFLLSIVQVLPSAFTAASICPHDVAGNRVGNGVGDIEVFEVAEDIVYILLTVRSKTLLRIGVVDKAHRNARSLVGSRGDLVRSDRIDTANVFRLVGGIVDGGDVGSCYRTEQ